MLSAVITQNAAGGVYHRCLLSNVSRAGVESKVQTSRATEARGRVTYSAQLF